MLRLITFGGLSLTSDIDGTVLKSHSRRQRILPLLALVATDRSRALSRDAMAALLWPDTDGARHSLETAISQVRQLAKGERPAKYEDVFAPGSALALNRSAISADVWEFEAALEKRELERAVSICDGRMFAAGVVVEGNDLQQELDKRRMRYTELLTDALTQLARRATELGDLQAVTQWRRRIVDLAPTERGATLALVDALVAQGETVHAVATAERYQRQLEILEHEADPVVAQRIAQLRRTTPPSPRPSVPPPLPPRAAPRPEPDVRDRLAQLLRPRWELSGPAAPASIVTSWPAVDSATKRVHVEVHVVRAHVAPQANPDRFVETLHRVAHLQHARVLPILEHGAQDRLLYFVTPARLAPTLKARLAREHQLPVDDTIALARAMAVALAHAHERGVVHGDLRPKHVQLPGPCDPIVGFFGLVDAVAEDHVPARHGSSYRILFGEREYQSPEQLRQIVVTSQRSDVWAFGAMIYEMLLGEQPFAPAGGLVDPVRKLSEAPEPFRWRRENMPEALERIVLTCLQRVPADRYASGVELFEALAALDS